jgi:hypothetical protein
MSDNQDKKSKKVKDNKDTPVDKKQSAKMSNPKDVLVIKEKVSLLSNDSNIEYAFARGGGGGHRCGAKGHTES